jgi:exodeoxyribonuclease VII large subunit
MAVPDRREIIEGLRDIRRHLTDAATALVQDRRYTLLTLQRRMEAVRPEQRVAALTARLESIRLRMNNAVDAQLPAFAHRIGMAGMRLDSAMDKQLALRQEEIVRAKARLTALNPSAVLERGYALVMDGDRVVSSADKANAINQMTLRFHDGSVTVERRK